MSGLAPPNRRYRGSHGEGRASAAPPAKPSSSAGRRRGSLPADRPSKAPAGRPQSRRQPGTKSSADSPPGSGSRPGANGRASVAARPRRSHRWLARFRLLTGLIVVISASVLVAWGLRRYLRSSPRFAIKSVVVQGNERRTAAQVAKRAGAEIGQNIFSFELQLARELVEADEWIASAAVARELPNAIRIEVTEREARALAAIEGELLLVDSKGTLFKKLRPGDPNDLPVVTGLEPDHLARDLEGVTQRLRRMLDLIADFERAGIERRYPVQEVHLEPDDSVVVTIGSDAIAVQVGRPPYRVKVGKIRRILAEVARRKAKPDVLFLDDEAHPERVVVRMR